MIEQNRSVLCFGSLLSIWLQTGISCAAFVVRHGVRVARARLVAAAPRRLCMGISDEPTYIVV